jgi:hypothetical protein
MDEIHEPGVLQTPKPKRKVKVSDIVIFGLLIIIIVALTVVLLNKLTIKHAVDSARPISDKAIAAIQARDGNAARKLGDKEFQSKNSAEDLTTLFKKEEIATLKKPTLDRTIVYHGDNGRIIFFIYKYTALKVPFYVRTAVTESSGQWHLTNLDGTIDESKLIIE